jgi:hypothetical protein
MATTTPNYGWSVPTSTDLVKDGAVAIETLGDSADATVKALNPETTLGDIAYRSATANTNTRLAIGTTGQILTVASGVPSWATPAGGGGKVLQVVNASYATTTSSTTGTYADTGLTATITPTSATSKILVIANQNGCGKDNVSNTGLNLRLLRGATEIRVFGKLVCFTNSAIFNYVGSTSVTYLDSPATTSATTYKTQQAAGLGSGTCFTQADSENSTITLLEIGA